MDNTIGDRKKIQKKREKKYLRISEFSIKLIRWYIIIMINFMINLMISFILCYRFLYKIHIEFVFRTNLRTHRMVWYTFCFIQD